MQRRVLGRSGLEVGVVGVGTWRVFDVPPGDERAVAIRSEVVSNAIEEGANLFDSSPMYGSAEEVLERALGDRRADVLIATKVWSGDVEEGLHQIGRALKYYGGVVDVYQVHNLIQCERYLPIFRRMREEGTVRAIGVTHYAHSAFGSIMRIMEREQLDCIQIPYDAADPRAAREVLPLAAETKTGVIVMSPLGSGNLLRSTPPQSELEPLAPYGVRTWAQALLKWVVSDERVTVTIPATSKPERARENTVAGHEPLLPAEERERVGWLASRLAR